MKDGKILTVSQVIVSTYDKRLKVMNSQLKRQKQNESKLKEARTDTEKLKKSLDASGIKNPQIIEKYKKLVSDDESIAKDVSDLGKTIRRERIKLWCLRALIKSSDYFIGSIALSIGVLFLLLSLDNITGNRIYTVIYNHKSDVQVLLNGLYTILGSLGYLMANRRMLYMSDTTLWIIYGFLGNIAAWEMRVKPSLEILSLWIVILSLISFFTLSVRGLSRLLKRQVGDSKDRLTIVIAVIGVIISMIALFK